MTTDQNPNAAVPDVAGLSKEEIAEGRRLHAAATPGPWSPNKWASTAIEGPKERGICSTGGYTDNRNPNVFDENEANAGLIVHMRAHYPCALDQIESQSAAIARLTERCEAYKGQVEAGSHEIERLKERCEAADWERDCVQSANRQYGESVAFWRARAEAAEARVKGLLGAVQLFQDRMHSHGNWDDGCFYYNGTSASELLEPMDRAQAALANQGGVK